MPGRHGDPFYDQRGQAMLLVLVAILLFAALAYVVTQVTPVSRQAAAAGLRTAQRVAAYPAAIEAAVKRMLSDGIAVTALDFRPGDEGAAEVFSPANGLAYRSPAAALGNRTEWSFKGIDAGGSGYFISGIGTDGPEGKDVIAYLSDVPKPVCEDINEALGLKREPLAETPPVELNGKGGGPKDTAGKNAYSFNAYADDPKPGACVQNGSKYVYFHVIVAK
jgi:hypothetical protein